ncbi:alpha/beta hydrolase family protein [Solitalea canadensis]|nr:alpha/beta hydrolase [Solitalea canadensis]
MLKRIPSLIILLFASLSVSSQSLDIVGGWYGVANIGNQLRLNLYISRENDKLRANMDSPDQKVFGIPVDEITLNTDTLTIKIHRIGFSYKGIYNIARQTIVGQFMQSGFVKELSFGREEIQAVLKAEDAQDKAQELPYYKEEIVFRNKKDKIDFSGSFTRPKGSGKYPAVVLISGSGPQDRDETISGHKPFFVLSDYLTKQGFAVLRYDDRGFGKSSGTFSTSSLYGFADDARAAFAYLKSRADVDATKIGLIGHSEGGYIASMIAADNKEIAFIVLLAGPGTTGKEVLLTQTRILMEAGGAEESRIKTEENTIRKASAVIFSDKDSIAQAHELKTIFEDYWTKIPESDKSNQAYSEGFVNSRVKIWQSSWFSEFVKFDPKPYLEKVKCPVLAINGTKDLQVEYKSNLSAIQSALEKGGNQRVTFAAMENLNHLFQTAQKGTVDEYAFIKETISPKALKLIGKWMKQETGK